MKDSLGTFISDLVLQILSWIAENECERIRKRQCEEIDLALANGVQFGRASIEITDEFIWAYLRRSCCVTNKLYFHQSSSEDCHL